MPISVSSTESISKKKTETSLRQRAKRSAPSHSRIVSLTICGSDDLYTSSEEKPKLLWAQLVIVRGIRRTDPHCQSSPINGLRILGSLFSRKNKTFWLEIVDM